MTVCIISYTIEFRNVMTLYHIVSGWDSTRQEGNRWELAIQFQFYVFLGNLCFEKIGQSKQAVDMCYPASCAR